LVSPIGFGAETSAPSFPTFVPCAFLVPFLSPPLPHFSVPSEGMGISLRSEPQPRLPPPSSPSPHLLPHRASAFAMLKQQLMKLLDVPSPPPAGSGSGSGSGRLPQPSSCPGPCPGCQNPDSTQPVCRDRTPTPDGFLETKCTSPFGLEVQPSRQPNRWGMCVRV